MNRTILAGATVALLACLPLATTVFGDTGGDRPTMQERAALFDARLVGFRAGLKLTADQDKNWPAFESALRGVAKDRAERRRQARARDDDGERPTPIDRLRRMSDRMARRSSELKLVADAAAPLYASLDEGQKPIFVAMFRDLAREGHHGERHRR
jgi:hypothetical protein